MIRLTTSDILPSQMKSVAKMVSEHLHSQGFPHALAGGIAAGEYSNPRFTSDVDFVVPEEAESAIRELGETFTLQGPVPGVGAVIDGIEVDFIFAPDRMPESAYDTGSKLEGIPVLDANAFTLMKMLAGRVKDTADVIEILKAGKIDRKKLRSYVKSYAPEELEDFDSLAMLADVENSMGSKHRKSSQNPAQIAAALRVIAFSIENANKPSRVAIHRCIQSVIRRLERSA